MIRFESYNLYVLCLQLIIETGSVTGSPCDAVGQVDTYTYNSIYQLTEVRYGINSAGELLINNNSVTPFANSSFTRKQNYNQDGVHNRNSLVETGATPKTVTYFLNPNSPPDDFQVNQYTKITTNGIDANQTHDNNGNNVTDGTNTYRFNYLNQLTEVVKSDNSRTVYRYDLLGRRISKKALNANSCEVNFINASTSHILYFSEGSSELEEFTTANALQKRFIYGIMIDEVLTIDVGGNRHYYHDTSLGSVAAITNSSAALQESYKFDVYGDEKVFGANNVILPGSTIGNPFRFTGRRRDIEEGSSLYQQRFRYYKPETGRFIQRDPLELWRDHNDLGNGFVYGYNNSINFVDPLGLQPEWWEQGWAVGPISAFKAKRAADEARKLAEASNLPGIHNGPQDAFRHCVWHCLMTRSIGESQAKIIGDIHERLERGVQPWIEEVMDKHNNWQGINAAKGKGRCEEECMKKLNAGELVTIQDSEVKPYTPAIQEKEKGIGLYYYFYHYYKPPIYHYYATPYSTPYKPYYQPDSKLQKQKDYYKPYTTPSYKKYGY